MSRDSIPVPPAPLWLARTLLAIELLSPAMLAPKAAHAASGGPDLGGYSWRDSDSGCTDVQERLVLANRHDFGFLTVHGPIDLGFDFPFYGTSVREVHVSMNGVVWLGAAPDPAMAFPSHGPIPLAGDGSAAFIAPTWEDNLRRATLWWEPRPDIQAFQISMEIRQWETATPIQWALLLFADGRIRWRWITPLTGAEITSIGMESPDETTGLEIWSDGAGSGGFDVADPPDSVCIDRSAALGCAAPAALQCGRALDGTLAATGGRVAAWGRGLSGLTAGERLHELVLAEAAAVTLTLTEGTARGSRLLILRSCSEWDVAAAPPSPSTLMLAPGRHLLAVDAPSAGAGTYRLTAACAPASAPIACGASAAVSAPAASFLQSSACAAGADLSGGEALFVVDVPPGSSRLQASIDPPGSDRVVLLWPEGAVLEPATCVAGGDGLVLIESPAAGRYVVGVDGPASSAPSTLHVTCAPQLDCSRPLALSCGGSVSGDTRGATSVVDAWSCSPRRHDGPETVITVDVAAEADVAFVLEGPPGLELVLLSGCGESQCADVADRVLIAHLPAGRHLLAVDGWDADGDGAGDAGPFTVRATCGSGLVPPLVRRTLAPGECFTEHKRGWLVDGLPKTDVLFLFDRTGSMGQELRNLQDAITEIMGDVAARVGDVQFGLASLFDYPFDVPDAGTCGYPDQYGDAGDEPWLLDQPVTPNAAAVAAAVDALFIGNGGDWPESYGRALFEAVEDPAVGWRPDSRRVILLIGDAMPHDCNIHECLGQTYRALGVDPGRDGLAGTPDDLPILDVIDRLAAERVTIVHLDSSNDAAAPLDPWDCWVERTGGLEVELDHEGLPPVGTRVADVVVDAILSRAQSCPALELLAEPGWEGWLVDAGVRHEDVGLPAEREWDIRICAPPDATPGRHEFEVRLTCGGGVVATQQVVVDVTCLAGVTPLPDVTACGDEPVVLDATGREVPCAGGADSSWSDGTTTWPGARVTLPAAAWGTFTFTSRCPAGGDCDHVETVEVTRELRPVAGAAVARAADPCRREVTLSWEPAWFPSSSGIHAVHRSAAGCAAALAAPPVAFVAGTSWIDRDPPVGTVTYAVVPEDSAAAVACAPPGAHHGGVVGDAACAAPVVVPAEPPAPGGMGWPLRVAHDGDLVSLDWSAARALLPGEHFHVLKGMLDARLPFARAGAHPGMLRRHEETDASAWLQFFDVRIANECEIESEDDEPPSR